MSTNKDIKLALTDPKRQARTSVGVLHKLVWSLIDAYDFSLAKLERTTKKYVNNPKLCVQISRRQTERKNNLYSTLVKKTAPLSWKKFIEALIAMDIRKVKITVETWQGDREIYRKVSHEIDTHSVLGVGDEGDEEKVK